MWYFCDASVIFFCSDREKKESALIFNVFKFKARMCPPLSSMTAKF